jgi:orotate phosphoribosyltransferase/AMMECR1 domain-containing protein
MPWLLYTWPVSLSQRGAELIAVAITERLDGFASKQLASIGYTGIPLLCACLAQGKGAYRGIVIRDEAKPYGSCRRIDGMFNPREGVVIVDDALVSGTSLYKAMRAVEEAGGFVEGIVALVEFPARGGVRWARSLGLRVETIFDVGRDLSAPATPRRTPWTMRYRAEGASVDDGLHPAEAARRMTEARLRDGVWPAPPAHFDVPYAASGGVFVSIRDRCTDRRLGRGGGWHFHPADADFSRDLLAATADAVERANVKLDSATLADAKFAVTLFTALEHVTPGQLDFQRYGIVVRSRERPSRVGGALPNTQFFTSTVEQYRHACCANARLLTGEAHDVFRHDVVKLVEPGQPWPIYGAPRDDSVPAVSASALIGRVEAVFDALWTGAELKGPALDDALLPFDVDGVAVSIFQRGFRACWISWRGSLDERLRQAAAGALRDPRWRENGDPSQPFAFVVSLLHDPETIRGSPALAAQKVRLGLDALAVRSRIGSSCILPMFAIHRSWSSAELASNVARKARIADQERGTWTTYQATSWIRDGATSAPLIFGFPAASRERSLATIVETVAAFLARIAAPSGLLPYAYDAATDRLTWHGSLGRILLGVTALWRAGSFLRRDDYCDIARNAARTCLTQRPHANVAAETQLLVLLVGTGVEGSTLAAAELAKKLRGFCHPDGAVTTRAAGQRLGADHDHFPALVIGALAEYARDAIPHLDRILEFSRRRFRLRHPWTFPMSHARAWSRIDALQPSDEIAEFVFEIIDWALQHQEEKSGAFLVDYAEGPGFHTAAVMEGLAAAIGMADRRDSERAARYRAAWDRAKAFAETLVIGEDDAFFARNPERVIGAVREARNRAAIRIDYPSHLLLATITRLKLDRKRSENAASTSTRPG